MPENERMQLFEDQAIRTAWDEQQEEWYFPVVDEVKVLTDSPNCQTARNCWKVTKKRLKDEGNQSVTNCNQLKLKAADGKRRLTDEIARAWSGMTMRQYKNLKGLKKESLRDNMSTLELALNMLAEAAATEISKEQKPQGFDQNRDVAWQGGEAAKVARESVERSSGKPVITGKNAAQLNHLVTAMLEASVQEVEERLSPAEMERQNEKESQ